MKDFYCKGVPELIMEMYEHPIKYRKISYKGRGRPRKSDYIVLKYKDLEDYQCMEMLENGFVTNYTNP